MGGRGSGRKPSEETLVKRNTEVRTPIATGMYLPNLSGLKGNRDAVNYLSSTYVPYTGANANVNLGAYSFTTTGNLNSAKHIISGSNDVYNAEIIDDTSAVRLLFNKTTSGNEAACVIAISDEAANIFIEDEATFRIKSNTYTKLTDETIGTGSTTLWELQPDGDVVMIKDLSGVINLSMSGTLTGATSITTSGYVYATTYCSAANFQPGQSTDAAAPNNSIYYSTTQSKLVYKDPGGTAHALY